MTKKFLILLSLFGIFFTPMLAVASIDQNIIDEGGTPSLPPTRVIVSERIPGVECTCLIWDKAEDGSAAPDVRGEAGKACPDVVSVAKRKYECTVEGGLAGFQGILASIVRWFVYIVMLLGVLSLVGLGIAWSLAGGDDAKAKSSLKKWAVNILVGMIILFFFRYILQFLAPWIYQ